MSLLPLKRTLAIGTWLVLLIGLAAFSTPALAQTEDDNLPWGAWVTLQDNNQDLIRYRTVTFQDTLHTSDFKTQYQIHNQYATSVSLTLGFKFEADTDGFDLERKWHLGPNSTGTGYLDTETIISVAIKTVSFHTGDPLPQ